MVLGKGGTEAKRGRWSRAEEARLKQLYGLRDDADIARQLQRNVASVRRMARKLFPGNLKGGPWTAEETLQLKRYLGASTPEVIARILGRSQEEVSARIFELGRIRQDGSWPREDLAEFKRIYGTRTDEDLARVFGRSQTGIRHLARELGLSKDKRFVCKLKGEASTRMPRWSTSELDFLREAYPTQPNLTVARRLGRSVKSVVSKAHAMRLAKSPERLREMGRENVAVRYSHSGSQARDALNKPAEPRRLEREIRLDPPADPSRSHSCLIL